MTRAAWITAACTTAAALTLACGSGNGGKGTPADQGSNGGPSGGGGSGAGGGGTGGTGGSGGSTALAAGPAAIGNAAAGVLMLTDGATSMLRVQDASGWQSPPAAGKCVDVKADHGLSGTWCTDSSTQSHFTGAGDVVRRGVTWHETVQLVVTRGAGANLLVVSWSGKLTGPGGAVVTAAANGTATVDLGTFHVAYRDAGTAQLRSPATVDVDATFKIAADWGEGGLTGDIPLVFTAKDGAHGALTYDLASLTGTGSVADAGDKALAALAVANDTTVTVTYQDGHVETL
ncbi:hypothetical protein [Anaeromyxobacter diazotrophicus]|uniref:Lipoprotein n=1 Tax=Anaeromyxobacter diazotrophicus TaxID=2590199 RepID=A0A7I9VPA4_9BACT|nr:hypothetical protein [Anaeromyxobacter diazotrophicus]GEJ57777.1 hypothetical protein AMYX_25180 [Anaeromyxobacter diazotrophicus]